MKKRSDLSYYDALEITVGGQRIAAPSFRVEDLAPRPAPIEPLNPVGIKAEFTLTYEASEKIAGLMPALSALLPNPLSPLFVSLEVPDAKNFRRRLARGGFRGRRGALPIDLHRLPITFIGKAEDGSFEAEISLR